jgi:hypothetical protein
MVRDKVRCGLVTTPSDPLPKDLAAAHAMILAQREMLTIARSEVTVGRLEIERLKLMLAKARREQFGQSSERGKQLIEGRLTAAARGRHRMLTPEHAVAVMRPLRPAT